MRVSTAIQLVACLTLLGCVMADDATAANFRPPIGASNTAWSVLSGNPALSQIAAIIQRLGLQSSFEGPFSGTLLLPTNDAVDDYMAQVELLWQKDGVFVDPDVERRMWGNLLEYHQLPRANSLSQKGSRVTLTTIHLDQGAASRAGFTAATKTFHKPWSGGPFHKLTFLCSGAVRAAAATPPDADPQTFRRCEATSIRDEQNNIITFASKNTPVLGRGLIHTVNAVLQPNDVYPSLAALLSSDPDLSIWTNIITIVTNKTSCWEGPAYLDSFDCCYCSETGKYVGGGKKCVNGCEVFPNNPAIPPDCSSDPYTCYPNGTVCFDSDYFTCPPGLRFAASTAAAPVSDGVVTIAKKDNRANCKAKNLCQLEGIFGTFTLPVNSAFNPEEWGPLDPITGVPRDTNAARWKPIVQFHFIKANAKGDFVNYNARSGGFGRNNQRPTLLARLKNNDKKEYDLTFESVGGSQSIKYTNNRGRPASTGINELQINIPPHIAHKVDRVMTPPCDPKCSDN